MSFREKSLYCTSESTVKAESTDLEVSRSGLVRDEAGSERVGAVPSQHEDGERVSRTTRRGDALERRTEPRGGAALFRFAGGWRAWSTDDAK